MGFSTSSSSLKLHIDTKNKKVLFAEAGKEFVMFLHHFLSFSVGFVLGYLPLADDPSVNGLGLVGCLANFRTSISNIAKDYFLKDNQTYIVMDDLVVYPISASVLTNSEFKNVTDLQVKEFKFVGEEASKLFKAAVELKTIDEPKTLLTNVFLGN